MELNPSEAQDALAEYNSDPPVREASFVRFPVTVYHVEASTQDQCLDLLLQPVSITEPGLSDHTDCRVHLREAIYKGTNLWAKGTSVCIKYCKGYFITVVLVVINYSIFRNFINTARSRVPLAQPILYG